VLKRRLIPKLLLRRAGTRRRAVIVTTLHFTDPVEVGEPASVAKVLEAQAADELLLLDIDASRERSGPATDVLKRVAERVFMPLTAGGGIRSPQDVRELLRQGADKVSLNSAALARPELIRESAQSFGSQCVVVSIDARRASDGSYRVFARGGSEPTPWEAAAWAREAESLGAGEILVTSIDRDGTRQGLDLELLRRVVAAVAVPVIASGGCGRAEHLVAGFNAGADAVAAGTYFCFEDQSFMQARAQVRNAGIPIRQFR
jgi:cyclase